MTLRFAGTEHLGYLKKWMNTLHDVFVDTACIICVQAKNLNIIWPQEPPTGTYDKYI